MWAASWSSRHRGLGDLCADGRQCPPIGAEGLHALALRRPGSRVVGERVERVARVCDLELPVLALRRSEQSSLYPSSCRRLADGEQQWPCSRTGTVTRARLRVVGREHVSVRPFEPTRHMSDRGGAECYTRAAGRCGCRRRDDKRGEQCKKSAIKRRIGFLLGDSVAFGITRTRPSGFLRGAAPRWPLRALPCPLVPRESGSQPTVRPSRRARAIPRGRPRAHMTVRWAAAAPSRRPGCRRSRAARPPRRCRSVERDDARVDMQLLEPRLERGVHRLAVVRKHGPVLLDRQLREVRRAVERPHEVVVDLAATGGHRRREVVDREDRPQRLAVRCQTHLAADDVRLRIRTLRRAGSCRHLFRR